MTKQHLALISTLEHMMFAQHEVLCAINNTLPIGGFENYITEIQKLGEIYDETFESTILRAAVGEDLSGDCV